MRRKWPLVGRQAELRAIHGLLESAELAGVIVAGPPGVGKTRLAQAYVDQAEQDGDVTARVVGTRAGSGIPFGALAPLLPASDPNGAATVSEDLGTLLRRYTTALVQRAAGRRLVLLVDDAHLLDDASATLVHQLAATQSARIVATVRAGEPAADAVTALWTGGLVERIELRGLDSAAIEELLEVALGGSVDPASAAHLAERSQGNMLFLRELVLEAATSGALVNEGGFWRLTGRLTPSGRLVELIEARLGSLSRAERALVELVALGEPLGHAEQAALADPALAEALEEQGLVQARRDGRRLEVRLAHPLYGDVVRARIPHLRSRALCKALADAVEGSGARRREDVLRVATWRLEAGGPVQSRFMLAAAKQARLAWALPLAERLAKAAVEAGAGFEADVLLGELSGLQGRHEVAEAHFADLQSRAETDAQRATLAGMRMDNLVLGLGRLPEAMHVAQAAEAVIVDLPARDALAVKRSHLVLIAGRTGEALDIVEPLLGRAQGLTLVLACMTAGHSLAMAGRISDAIEATHRGEAEHLKIQGLPPTLGPHVHSGQRCSALEYAGDFAGAERLASETRAKAIAEGSAEAQAMHAWCLARTLLAMGLAASAARFADEAAGVYRTLGWPQWLRWPLMTLAHALALMRRTAEGRKVLAEIDALGIPPTAVWGADLLRSRAWVDVASGNVQLAAAHLREAAALAGSNRERVFEAAVLHDLARLGYAADVSAGLTELVAKVEGPLTRSRARHAEALARDDPSELEACSLSFEAMGALLLAGEAAADAALARRKAGSSRLATAAERRARALAARCEGAVTPQLGSLAARAVLTRAERDVAALAAAGRSNPEIADALCLSRKTVENYLHRTYEKLGISKREELSVALDG